MKITTTKSGLTRVEDVNFGEVFSFDDNVYMLMMDGHCVILTTGYIEKVPEDTQVLVHPKAYCCLGD